MNNNAEVKVTVLITAYNEEEKIERCLKSILEQTYKNFEIVLINDGSIDSTDEKIKIFISKNSAKNIRYYSRENKGRLISLNEGIFLAKGKYIAIQDADDYSLPNRLEKQVEYLEKHPNIDILGTAYYRLDAIRKEKYIRIYPETDKEIKKEMCKYIPLCQGSMMAKIDVLKSVGGYNINCKDAEDLDLWVRLGNKATFANLREPYYVYDLTMENSYFHKKYNFLDRNKRVFKLNCKAIKAFDLPKYNYIICFLRLLYPYIPVSLKKILRTKFSRIKEKNFY